MSEMADPMRIGERVAIQYAYRPEYTSSSGTACRRRRPAWPDEMKAFVSRSTLYTHGSNANTLLDPALRWRLSVEGVMKPPRHCGGVKSEARSGTPVSTSTHVSARATASGTSPFASRTLSNRSSRVALSHVLCANTVSSVTARG